MRPKRIGSPLLGTPKDLPAAKDFQLAHEGIGLDPEKDHIDMSTCTVIFCIAFQLLQ